MFRNLIWIIPFILPFQLFSQTHIIIKGKLKDEVGDVIRTNVRISQIKSPQFFTHSENSGTFILPYDYAGDENDGILIHSTWFQNKRIKITKRQVKRTIKDTLYLTIQLPYITLEGPVIKREKAPDIVFGDPVLGVHDFELHQDKLVLLTFEKSMRKGAEIALANEKEIISRLPVPGTAVKLFKDYLDRIFVICKEQVFECSIGKDNIVLNKVDREVFYERIWLVIDTLSNQFYYSNINELYPAFEYFTQKFTDTLSNRFHHVENELIMDLYRAEYKYASGQEKLWAVRKEMATGIDKEIWMGAKYFTNSIYYKVPYAPLFIQNNQVLIFDHYQDYLFKYDVNNQVIDSVPIYYHKLTRPVRWEQPLIADEITEEVYSLFMKQGHFQLKKINTETGFTSTAFQVYYKFVEAIKIANGFVYYIYRPYESAQERFIYRESIKTQNLDPVTD